MPGMQRATSSACSKNVQTAVTGWFGQNIAFPGKDGGLGLVESTVLILGLSLTLYVVFRRKGWI